MVFTCLTLSLCHVGWQVIHLHEVAEKGNCEEPLFLPSAAGDLTESKKEKIVLNPEFPLLMVIVLQARVRGLMARRQCQVLICQRRREDEENKAALLIQNFCRTQRVRSAFKAEVRILTIGAVRLQALARGRMARMEYLSLLKVHMDLDVKATIIQRVWRGSCLRKHIQQQRLREETERAALVIQKFCRSQLLRIGMKKELECRTLGVIKVQALVRGRWARLQYISLVENRMEEGLKAIKIQKVWRGSHIRRKQIKIMSNLSPAHLPTSSPSSAQCPLRALWSSVQNVARGITSSFMSLWKRFCALFPCL